MSAARSSSGRRPSAGRRPGPGGRAPSRPGGRPQGGPGPSAGRPAPDRVRPLLPGEARGALASLLLFAVGFAVAGVLVAAGLGSTPGYYIAISLGLVGIGALGFFSRRTPADAPPPPVWSPRGLTRIAHGAGVPARLVVISFYALLAISVLGNLVVPLLTRR